LSKAQIVGIVIGIAASLASLAYTFYRWRKDCMGKRKASETGTDTITNGHDIGEKFGVRVSY